MAPTLDVLVLFLLRETYPNPIIYYPVKLSVLGFCCTNSRETLNFFNVRIKKIRRVIRDTTGDRVPLVAERKFVLFTTFISEAKFPPQFKQSHVTPFP